MRTIFSIEVDENNSAITRCCIDGENDTINFAYSVARILVERPCFMPYVLKALDIATNEMISGKDSVVEMPDFDAILKDKNNG